MVEWRLGRLCRSLFWTMRRFMICCRAMAAEDLGLDGQRAMAPILRERWGRAWGRGEDSPGWRYGFREKRALGLSIVTRNSTPHMDHRFEWHFICNNIEKRIFNCSFWTWFHWHRCCVCAGTTFSTFYLH